MMSRRLSLTAFVALCAIGCDGSIGAGSSLAEPEPEPPSALGAGAGSAPDATISGPSPVGSPPPLEDASGADGGSVPDADGAARDTECAGLLCEAFDEYPAGTLDSGAALGPWTVSVNDAHGVVSIDQTRAASGSNALKVHIDDGAGSGGQLLTTAAPLFEAGRTALYGRFKMYIGSGADGTSQHWTMVGAEGTVPAGSPAAGDHATYLFSSFPLNDLNSFSAVYYDDQTAQDCYQGSNQLMPLDRWACVAFSVDSVAQQYRLWLDGAPVPSMSVNVTGDGCGNAPPQTPWYGPVFDELYIGALSFHPMVGALDLWIDDVVVDTQPVSCP